jgi:hypothetical protein
MVEDLRFNYLIHWTKEWFFLWRQSLKMGLAIRLADIKQKAYNKQYHIMILNLPKGEKLLSVSRTDIMRLKHKKWLPKNVDMLKLRESIFYSTPLCRNNSINKEERKKAKEKYLKYCLK